MSSENSATGPRCLKGLCEQLNLAVSGPSALAIERLRSNIRGAFWLAFQESIRKSGRFAGSIA
ncbi:MAG TPA: hypothetical protein VM912_15160, partial [Terriglobales bacterium]|nr:hypothetical protein [Terriglobales bacterium]